MKRYSHRIRAIDLTTLNLPTVRLNIVDAVFSPGLSNELFPSLHALGPNVTSGLPPPDPILFPGPIRLPQLVRLNFRIPKFYMYRNPVLRFVPACAPSLKC